MQDYQIVERGILTREIQVLNLCYEQGLLTKRQLRTWLLHRYALKNQATAKTAAIRVITYLEKNNLIRLFSTEIGDDQDAFCLTAKGLSSLFDHGFRFTQNFHESKWTPDKINHDIRVTDVRLAWEYLLPKCYWYPELYLKINHPEPLPDALLGYYSAKYIKALTIGIEVELTQKSRNRYIKKFAEYEQTPFNLIFYFTASQTIANMILDVSQDISDTIYVVDLDQFIRSPIETRLVSHRDQFMIKEKMEYVWKE